jgi:hypothetical protein
VAVVGVPDLTWGQKVGAVIVPVAGAQIHLNTLRYGTYGYNHNKQGAKKITKIASLRLQLLETGGGGDF